MLAPAVVAVLQWLGMPPSPPCCFTTRSAPPHLPQGCSRCRPIRCAEDGNEEEPIGDHWRLQRARLDAEWARRIRKSKPRFLPFKSARQWARAMYFTECAAAGCKGTRQCVKHARRALGASMACACLQELQYACKSWSSRPSSRPSRPPPRAPPVPPWLALSSGGSAAVPTHPRSVCPLRRCRQADWEDWIDAGEKRNPYVPSQPDVVYADAGWVRSLCTTPLG